MRKQKTPLMPAYILPPCGHSQKNKKWWYVHTCVYAPQVYAYTPTTLCVVCTFVCVGIYRHILESWLKSQLRNAEHLAHARTHAITHATAVWAFVCVLCVLCVCACVCVCVCVCACACMCVCVLVCLCVCQRERDRASERASEQERQNIKLSSRADFWVKSLPQTMSLGPGTKTKQALGSSASKDTISVANLPKSSLCVPIPCRAGCDTKLPISTNRKKAS